MPLDTKKLAVIHIVKKELGLSDAQYRRILRQASGVESAKDLSEESFRKLMNFFVRSRYYRANPQGLTIKQKLYIKYLAGQLAWGPEHLNNFIKKYYHKAALEILTRKEAAKLIESLKAIEKKI